MNYTGLITASRAVEQDIDQYEDDVEEKSQGHDKNYSYLYFKPFDERKVGGEWSCKMPLDENIETIAGGSGWVAC